MSDNKIQWHPGFVAAANLEFRENKNDLSFEKEHNLNTRPLEIDLLVIKKNKDARIVNEIGRIFKGHNIMEYKCPGDSLDIDVFYKSIAYACLYKSYGQTVDAIRAFADSVITVSVEANRDIVAKMRGGDSMYESLYETLKPIFDPVIKEKAEEMAEKIAEEMAEEMAEKIAEERVQIRANEMAADMATNMVADMIAEKDAQIAMLTEQLRQMKQMANA